MSKFNSKSVGTKTVNFAGGKSFSMDSKSELVTLVLCSFLSDKFYESEDSQLKRLVKLIESTPHEFISKLAIYARKEFHMRSVSHVLLAELSRLHKGDSLVKNTTVDAAERPDDLMEVLSYYGNKYGKPIPNALKKGIAKALTKFSSYQLLKYQGKSRDVKLVDLFNISHPKGTKEQVKMWGKLLKGQLQPPETWEVLISTAKNKEEAKARWEQLIMEDKLGYMAMLRNLRNFDKYGISEEAMQKVYQTLIDPEKVKKSKQLPFRFYNAYENAPSTLFKDAASYALDIAVDNVPKFDGKTLVCVDISGSMSSNLSGKGNARYIDIAALFGGALFKANSSNTDVFCFDDRVIKLNLSSRTPLIDLIKTINTPGGSTDLWKVFKALEENKLVYDRIVILSDMQAWNSYNYYYSGYGVNQCFESYKKTLGINPKIYSIDLSGYGTLQFPQKNINLLAGWSEKIFDLMKALETDKSALLHSIENYEIQKTVSVDTTKTFSRKKKRV